MTIAMAAPAVFDEVAERYDDEFSNTLLGRLVRQRVWDCLSDTFAPGARVLELGCGTGEDAMFLARRGVSVLATDVSTGMLRTTAAKVAAAGQQSRIEIARLDANRPSLTGQPMFDGVLSDFGGLNCVADLRYLSEWLGSITRPRAAVAAVVMGPFCAWETLASLLRGDMATARRRARRGALANVGRAQLPVWYPSPRTLGAAFSAHFRVVRAPEGIGSLLPPSYLARLVERHPRLFTAFARAERHMPLSAYWADHYLMVFERR